MGVTLKRTTLVFPLNMIIGDDYKAALKRVLCYGLVENARLRMETYKGAIEKEKAKETKLGLNSYDDQLGVKWWLRKLIREHRSNVWFERLKLEYCAGDEVHDLIILSLLSLKSWAHALICREIRTISEFKEIYLECQRTIIEYEGKYEKDSMPQISIDILKSAFGGSISQPKFRLICAISAILSRGHSYIQITSERLFYSMCGYKSYDIWCEETGGDVSVFEHTDNDRPQLIAKERKKIERLVKDSHEDGLIKGVWTYKRRQKFYSTRMTTNEIEEAFLRKKKAIKYKRLRAELFAMG